MTLLALLIGCAVIMNVAALVPKMPSILSYIAAPFWLLAGVQAKSMATDPVWWKDIFNYLFFLFSVGLSLLSIFEGISIKKVDVQLEREADEAELAGEHDENMGGSDEEEEGEGKPSYRVSGVRKRADQRRARAVR